jgi:hypothetical protein
MAFVVESLWHRSKEASMDWATFFKEYQGIIAVVSGLVLAILGYVVGRWNTVENRAFTRRAVIRDMRIKEARDYIDAMLETVQRMVAYENRLVEFPDDAGDEEKAYGEVVKLLNAVKKNKISIFILNDWGLTHMLGDLGSLIEQELKHIPNKLKSRDGYSIVEELIRVEEFDNGATVLIAAMQARLDELAQKTS